MIIVQTMDDELHIVKDSWVTFHPKGKIKKIFLTDYCKIMKELKGCDKYFVVREAVGVKGPGMQENRTVRETVYGLVDMAQVKIDLNKAMEEMLVRAMKEHPETKEAKTQEIKKQYKKLLQVVENKEVTEISLVLHERICSTKQTLDKLLLNQFKEGVKRNVGIEDVLGKNYKKQLKVW